MLAVGKQVLVDFEPQYVRMTTGLGGGLAGGRQEMCGALSAGVLIIGALFGRASAAEADETAYKLAAQFRERFLEELGNTQCAQLRRVVEAPDGPGTCVPLVGQAAGILLDLLEQVQFPG